MRALRFFVPVVALAVGFSGCGGKAKTKNKVAIEEAKPGRDLELFRSAINEVRSGHSDSGRVLFNTILNTYPDSPLIKETKLAIPDTYYLEGGTKNLAQAEAGYREFLEFFPDDPLADDVRLKIAEVHMRQVVAPDRDTTHARLAERELKELVRLHPNTPKKEEVEARIREIQEYLAMHELKVARFYYNVREAAAATQGRTEEILNKYPSFSRLDEALYYHAKAMADQEDTETASQDLARLIRVYPKSDFRGKAEGILKKWNKPVPEADPERANEPGVEGKSVVPRFLGFVFGPKVSNLSSKGVIIDRDLKTDEIVARARELSGPAKPGGPVTPGAATTSNADARPRRAAQAGQDVEVKPGSPANQTDQKSDKDKKKKTPKNPPGESKQ